jgi:hypothetical protein
MKFKNVLKNNFRRRLKTVANLNDRRFIGTEYRKKSHTM